MSDLFIDLETYSSVDMANGETIPANVLSAFKDKTVRKHAHNATFERLALKAYGIDVPAEQWHCTMFLAAYCGYPLSLGDCSVAMNLTAGKMAEGKDLIKYFSMPYKPRSKNAIYVRNIPADYPEKWNEYKAYNIRDVEAEREIWNRLCDRVPPPNEYRLYALDQKINERGVLIDIPFVEKCIAIDTISRRSISGQLTTLTGVNNPNSAAQLKMWLTTATGKEVTTLARGELPNLRDESEDDTVRDVIDLRLQISKSSIKKYAAMINSAGADDRTRGVHQLYGANRTGRFAGRLIQLQNLPQNHIETLETARALAAAGDIEGIEMIYGDVPDTLSQLIRTAIIAPPGMKLAVADFSAIEARVISWLAMEKWRTDVFRGDGKIYEATAARMFGVSVESVTKGSEYRQKGKIAELALGFGGGKHAIERMGGAGIGLSEAQMQTLVNLWRRANPNVVNLWSEFESLAVEALTGSPGWDSRKRVYFAASGGFLSITLPSGRKLNYAGAKYDNNGITYYGTGEGKKWMKQKTYGGKIIENVVQAIARDLLCDAMLRIDAAGIYQIMHVHDESVAETFADKAKETLAEMIKIMSISPDWAAGLPLTAAGFITDFYKKD